MISKMAIEAVTFDVDGTFYSTKRMVLKNLLGMLPVLGFFRDLHLVRDTLRGMGPFEDFRAEQARRLSHLRKVSERQAAQMVERVVDEFWMHMFTKVPLYSGVRETLESLVQLHLHLGLISDYPLVPKLQRMGLADLPFQALVVSEKVGALKPHPKPFQEAAEALAVDPKRILHVGDREECDVAGSLAAGMRSALFFRGKKRPTTRAEFCFSDWRGLIPALRERGMLVEP